MNQEDDLKKAEDRYDRAKKKYERLLADYQLQLDHIRAGEYYSVSGVKLDMPFVPSSDAKIAAMLELLGDIKGKTAADLGCGDGKIIAALALAGTNTSGFELEPSLIKKSLARLAKSNLKAEIIEQNFFTADLSRFNIITLYGITSMMDRLEKKLTDELQPSSLIVSNTFIFPNWPIKASKSNVFLYQKD